jgi:hypothetical protein
MTALDDTRTMSTDPSRTFRPYDPERDLDAVRRIWRECGWVEEDEFGALDIVLGLGRRMVAEVDGAAECLVITTPGDMRYVDETLPFSLVYGVTTSRVARKQGLASRLTAQCVAESAADGAAVSGLGAFELGYYDKLGFGTGGYDHVLEFDPAQLRLPNGIRARPPKRLVAADFEAIHDNRGRRRRCHGSCFFPDPDMSRAELEWGKHGFGLGYRDGADGAISHHVWFDTGGKDDRGPYRVRWLAYETLDQLLELLALMRDLGNQVRLIRMGNPPGLQLQDLLAEPVRMRALTRGAELAQQFWFIAWWQMRILDLGRCLAATRLPGDAVRFGLTLTDPIEAYLPADAPWRGVGGEHVVTLGPESRAEPGRDASLPTMKASVNAFTRLWLGVQPATGLAATDELEAPGELLEALDRLVRLPVAHPDWDF